MAKLFNTESNVSLELNLVKNNSIDFKVSRPNFMNWLPFHLELRVGEEILKYNKNVSPTFSISELKFLLKKLNYVLLIKKSGKFLDTQFEYVSSENFFELIVKETQEENLIELEWWFNMGSLTNGKTFGYSRGYRFVSNIESFSTFVYELEAQFKSFM